MLLKENEFKFKELRIELRRQLNLMHYFGTIKGSVTQFDYELPHFKEIVILFN